MASAKRSKRTRSVGAVQLARTALTHEQIAKKLKCKREQVTRWLSGAMKPAKSWRDVICIVFKIDPGLWDEYPPSTDDAPELPVAPSGATTFDARVVLLQRMVDDELARLERDRESAPLERARVMKSIGSTVHLLGQITGEAQKIGETRILRLPAWRRIEAAIVKALEPWPKAARAVAEALQELGESGQ